MNLFPNIQRIPDEITVVFADGTQRFEGQSEIKKDDFRLTIKNNTVYLSAVSTPVTQIIFRYRGALPESCRFWSDAWERGYGDFEFRGFVFDRLMPWDFTVIDHKAAACYGVKVRPDAFCCFTADPEGITLIMTVSSGSDPVILNGKTIVCAEIICKEYDNTPLFELQHDFALLLANGLGIFPNAPVYGFNNWYFAYGRSTAEKVLENAALLQKCAAGLKNRPFYVIDDCWQEERPTGFIGGSWRRGNKAFPDMKALAENIKKMELRPGLWIRPLQNKDPAIPEHCYRNKEEFLLDPTHPDTLSFIAEDVNTICRWGYELIKYDYSTFDIFEEWGRHMEKCVPENIHFFDQSVTTAMAVKQLYKTVFEAAKGRALLMGCNCIGHLGVGYMQLNRTGDDTSGRSFDPTRRNGVNTLAFRMHQHNAFYFVDADCAGITVNVPWKLNEQWLKALAYSGTPLFVSLSPEAVTDIRLNKIAEYLTVASAPQPVSVPLDTTNNTCPEQWKINGETVKFLWY